MTPRPAECPQHQKAELHDGSYVAIRHQEAAAEGARTCLEYAAACYPYPCPCGAAGWTSPGVFLGPADEPFYYPEFHLCPRLPLEDEILEAIGILEHWNRARSDEAIAQMVHLADSLIPALWPGMEHHFEALTCIERFIGNVAPRHAV